MDKILHLGKKKSTKQSPPISISFPTPNPAGASAFFPHAGSPPFVPQTTYQPRASVSLNQGDRDQFIAPNSSSNGTYTSNNGANSNYTNNNSTSMSLSTNASNNGSSRANNGGMHGYQSHSGEYSTSSPPHSASGRGGHPSHYSSSSSPYFGSVSAATASVISSFTSGHHRGSSGLDRPTSPNNYDAQSVRSYRTSTSGTASEAGRTEAMSLARPRTDQEIEDRFVDFMASSGSLRFCFSCREIEMRHDAEGEGWQLRACAQVVIEANALTL
jgi:hypothetical protein